MKLRLVREARGAGRLYVDNLYLCFTQEHPDGTGNLNAGLYEILVEFNDEFRKELPRAVDSVEYWIYPAKPYGRVANGVAVGTVRNSLGVVNGFVAIEQLLQRLESAYDRGERIQLSIEEA